MAANEPMGTGHRHIHPVPQGRGHSTAQHSPCLCGGPVSPWPMAGTPGTACHAALVSSAENLSRLRLANWKACMHACHCHAIIVSLSPTELREEAQNQKPLLPLMNRASPPSLSLLESLESLNESSRPFSRPSGQEKVAKQQCRHFLGLRSSSSPASACTPHRLLHTDALRCH